MKHERYPIHKYQTCQKIRKHGWILKISTCQRNLLKTGNFVVGASQSPSLVQRNLQIALQLSVLTRI